ncbi:MAG: phenylalanine--tRNA ligase subunit beta [Flavobacteriaceae bacterium]|nr:phenylalanine--tRNA ligase subunit beta [Flavobacteriaceae bacterium]
MKISYNWLKEFLNIDLEADKVGKILTDLGLEVEGIETFESLKGSLKGVVVGEVLSCEQHANADRLKVTMVDLGNGEPVQIVCGAPNVAAGQKVPVATIGTTLYDEKGEGFTIKKGKIRGEASYGMICAEDELGLGKSHDGILVLDDDVKVGTAAAELFEIRTDQIFEIGLTPNRADAMSHHGVARDLYAGLLQQEEIQKKMITPSVSDFHIDERTFKINVDVEDNKLVPRYAGITITDLKVADSPEWLQNKLKSIGLTPINNIVDITNFILHGLGQPLHAFDANKIEGNKIWVKNLPGGTKFTTLDGVERELHEDDIMICDGESNPMCIAGVFGGENSGVTENTTSIFLESAYFNPVSVRKTAKRHALNTDASFRFERGINPDTVVYALKRAAIWIKEIAGGKIVSEITDIYPNIIEDFQVHISYERVFKLIGEEIPTDTIKNILASLDIKINNQTESGLGLTIPSYRVDVTREADIVEEILRVYGYNNIEIPKKINTSIASSNKLSVEKIENIAANYLVANGIYETMANSLTKASYISNSQMLKEEQNVNMLNALSSDLSVMRQSMLFGGLESVAYNINRKNKNLKFFEFGNTYHKYESGYTEQKHLSLIITGNRSKANWDSNNVMSDIFYLKGVIKALLQRLGINKVKYTAVKNDIFSEAIGLNLGKTKLVEFGIVKPNILLEFGIKQEVLFADFNWNNVLDNAGKKNIKVKALPKYPEVKRDLALLLDEEIKFIDLYNAAFQSEKSFLKNVDLFDVYMGDKLPEGKKSYALSFVLQDENKTLNDKQIDKIMQKLQQTFIKQFEAELR